MDFMSHRGAFEPPKGRGGSGKGALVGGQSQEASLKPLMMTHHLRREAARKMFFSKRFPPRYIPQNDQRIAGDHFESYMFGNEAHRCCPMPRCPESPGPVLHAPRRMRWSTPPRLQVRAAGAGRPVGQVWYGAGGGGTSQGSSQTCHSRLAGMVLGRIWPRIRGHPVIPALYTTKTQ